MRFEITHGPSFALLKVCMEPQESLTCEAGAMVTRSCQLQMKTRPNADASAGFWGTIWALCVAFIRKLIGGETFFVNDFSAKSEPCSLTLAPALAGQIVHHRLENQRILLQPGAYLASSPSLRMRLRWGGLRGILAREGLVFLEVSGTGDLFMNAYGGIQSVPIAGSFVVDNGHIVAFDGTLDFKITSPGGGAIGLFASGEGLVCTFTGTGNVYIQSRNLHALTEWLLRLSP